MVGRRGEEKNNIIEKESFQAKQFRWEYWFMIPTYITFYDTPTPFSYHSLRNLPRLPPPLPSGFWMCTDQRCVRSERCLLGALERGPVKQTAHSHSAARLPLRRLANRVPQQILVGLCDICFNELADNMRLSCGGLKPIRV